MRSPRRTRKPAGFPSVWKPASSMNVEPCSASVSFTQPHSNAWAPPICMGCAGATGDLNGVTQMIAVGVAHQDRVRADLIRPGRRQRIAGQERIDEKDAATVLQSAATVAQKG